MMRVTSECLPCLQRLIEMTVNAASPAHEIRERAASHAWGLVERMKEGPLSPAHLANRFYPLIKAICNNADPFARRKHNEMIVASHLAEKYAPSENASLKECITFSVQGNAIDFFRPIQYLEKSLLDPAPFAIDETELLEERLAGGKQRILWLGDNAGEVFFDVPVLRFLSRKGHRVLYAVKGDAVQNDVTLEDLRKWPEVLSVLDVIETGAATVGMELDRASEEFLRVFESSDIVVAKGMGHYETLDELDDPRLFFLLMAKCGPVARSLGTPLGRFAGLFARS
jgi:uncharacterized protein with ATP-grasp and redox domains